MQREFFIRGLSHCIQEKVLDENCSLPIEVANLSYVSQYVVELVGEIRNEASRNELKWKMTGEANMVASKSKRWREDHSQKRRRDKCGICHERGHFGLDCPVRKKH